MRASSSDRDHAPDLRARHRAGNSFRQASERGHGREPSDRRALGSGAHAGAGQAQARATRPGALRVSFITDIMTPYMAPVFDALASRCDLTVLFGSKTGSRAMAWSLATPSFRHRVMGGPVLRRSIDAADIYPNPRVLVELRRARPDVVISAGFSFPSLYAAAYCRTSRARLLVQSDGTSRSEAGIGLDQRLTRTVLARAAHGAVGNSYLAAQRLAELGFEPVFEAPHSTRHRAVPRSWPSAGRAGR